MQVILEALKPYALSRVVRKGTVLMYQGEVPRSVLLVRKGIIKAYTLTNTGNEQIVSFFTAGEPLALTWLFGKTSNSLYYYEAVDDCELYSIPREEFHQHVESNPELKNRLFQYLVNNNSGLLLRITALEQQRAVEKIVFTLYYLMFRYGVKDSAGLFHITLKLTHNSIASLVGLTRETTATELSKLKRKGILSYNATEYIVDKAKLERIMGEDSFQDLKLNQLETS